MRNDRRRDLLAILHGGRSSSQREIVGQLRQRGHDVTQATVSRDLRAIGALKVPSADGFVYRLPDEVPRPSGDLMARNLQRALDEFAVDVRPAASLVVVRTAPGHAMAVARAIDFAEPPEAVGTVAGDDTIFVATASETVARDLASRWSGHRARATEEA